LSSLERANKAQQQKLAKLETLAKMVAKHKSKNIGEFVSLVINWQDEGTFTFGEWEKKNFDQVVDCAKNIFEALFGKCGLMSQPILDDTRLPPSVVQEKLKIIGKCMTELHQEPPSTPRTRNVEKDEVIEQQADEIAELKAKLKQLSAEKKTPKRKRAPPPPPPTTSPPKTAPSKRNIDLTGEGGDGVEVGGTGGGDGDDGDDGDEEGGTSGKGDARVHRRIEEKSLLTSADLLKKASVDPENTDVVLSSNVVLPFKLLIAYSEFRAFPSVPNDHDWNISFVESLMNETLNDVRDCGGTGNALDEKGDAVITKFLSHFNFQKKKFSAEELETLIESLITLEKKLKVFKTNKSKYFVLVHYPPPH
jgi:hypothetical protein